jgi:superfamily II DNA or RNA helicase
MKEINLFGFQGEFKERIATAMRKHKRVLGVAATGFGKGVVIADIAKSAIIKGSVTCIAVHRIEIFKQVFNNLVSYGITPSLIAAGSKISPGSKCYLAMVDTLNSRIKKGMIEMLNINFFIMDEAHYASHFKVINGVDCFVLGLTASPKSTGNPELNKYFGVMVEGKPVKELIQIGRLVRARTFSVDWDFSKVKLNSKGTEFDEKSLKEEFQKPMLWDGAVNSYLKHANGLQALCFSANIERSLSVTEQFNTHGIKAAHVNGSTKESERDAIFDRYRRGDVQVICNVGIATTGTDLPNTKCVILDLATMSIVKYVQMVGRGARCAPDKDHFIVIDMGRNYSRFGEFGDYIDWKAIFDKPSLAAVKREKRNKRECSNCGVVMEFHTSKCPYCDHETARAKLDSMAEKQMTAEELMNYRHKMLPDRLKVPISSMSYSMLREYAAAVGHNYRWANIVHAKRRH